MFVRDSWTALFVAALLFLASGSSEAASLGLAWDPPQDGVTVGFVVKYGTSPGNYQQTIDVGNVTSYTITSLADGVTYYIAIQGYTSSREYGPLSNEVSGVTGLAAPRNLSASVTGSTVTLAWQGPASGISGYRIEVGSGPGQSNVAVLDAGTATTYSVAGVSDGTYYVRVRSLTSSGGSAPSNEVVLTVGGGGAGPLGAPTNLTASVSGSTVALNWQAPGAVSGYRIEVGRGPAQTNVAVVDTGPATSVNVPGVTEGTYYVRVRSLTSSGASAPSNEVVVTVGASGGGGGGSLTAPSNLSASVSGSTVALSWQASGPVSGYRIEVGRGPGQTNVAVVDAGPATTVGVTGVTEGTYYVRVRGLSPAGVSPPSNEVIVTVGGGGGSGSGSWGPSNLNAVVRYNGWVDLSWHPPSGAVDGYYILVGRGSGQSNVLAGWSDQSTYTITGLTEGTYYIRIYAVKSGVWSDASNEVVVSMGGG